MAEVKKEVMLPENSAAVADALVNLVTDIVKAKRSGLTGVGLIAAIGTSVINELADKLDEASQIDDEMAASPIGVAQAFSMAGFEVARSLTGK